MYCSTHFSSNEERQEQEVMGFGFLRSNVNNICMKGEGEGAQCLVSFFFAIQIHPESPFF